MNKTDCPEQEKKPKKHYIKQMINQKTVKRKFITTFQKQNFK